jgi:hypothetical protein
MLMTKVFCGFTLLTSQASAPCDDQNGQLIHDGLFQKFLSRLCLGALATMNANNATSISHTEADEDLIQPGALRILSDDFDDEEFLTSRAMYHCWSDRPRGHRVNARHPGRRRSTAKPARAPITGRR